MASEVHDLLRAGDEPVLVFCQDGREQFKIRLQRRLLIGRGVHCHVRLPGPADGLSREHLELERRGPRLLITDRSKNGTWLDGLRLGAEPLQLKPGSEVRLGGWLFFIESVVRDRECETAPPDRGRPPVDDGVTLVGDSVVMRSLGERIAAAARYEFPVHIRGETGSGKERVARSLHRLSARADHPFVALNCGAIHDQTAVSELFGHKRGSFTGASADRPGVFQLAEGGTVFLDEIAELSPRLQAALLRTLELREVQPLGADACVPVDFRLVSASHRDLAAEAAEGRFREDLLYRVKVTSLFVPPLRDRPEDVVPLARHFLSTHAQGTPPELSDAAELVLCRHPWPGNVRQLRNALLRAIVASQGQRIEPTHLQLKRADGESPTPFLAMPSLAPERARVHAQKAELVIALKRCNGNRTAAALMLGISRSTLYERLKRFAMLRD